MTATPETIDLSNAPAPEKRTLLESWSKLLESIESERAAKITPGIANRVAHMWPRIEYAQLEEYFDRYYDLMEDMRKVVEHEIATHPEALKNVEKDGEENAERYLNIMFGWQQVIIFNEHHWEPKAETAALDLAAIAEVQNFFLGDKGLLAHLGLPELGFEFDDEDTEALRIALQEWKDSL